jgi:hypothetical protein
MFGSRYTDYEIVGATPFGRDPMRELSQAKNTSSGSSASS